MLASRCVRSERLTGGDFRLRAGPGCFVIRRARPGVVTVVARGVDHGQFGTAVVDELAAELRRFPIQSELFIDAGDVHQVDLQVREAWTAWLRDHRTRLRTVNMLAETPAMALVADIARHYSGANLVVYRDRRAFEEALRASGEVPRPPETSATRATIRRELTAEGTSLDDGSCRYTFRSPCCDVLVVRIVGNDRGTLASAVFDEIRTYLAGPPLWLFIDLRHAAMPAAPVSELWAGWFTANRQALASVRILGTTRAIRVTAGIVSWRSGTGALIQLGSDPASFDRAVQELVEDRRQ